MRLEQWGAGKEHQRMASEYPEYVLGRVVLQEYFGVVERFSVFAAVGYNTVLGVQLFRMKPAK